MFVILIPFMATTVIGRPTKYNAEIANRIINELSTTTRGFEHICEDAGISSTTGWEWLAKHSDFQEKYRAARGMQSEHGYDEIREITDAPLPEVDIYDLDGNHLGRKVDAGVAMAEMQRRKLQIDAIKFKLVKLQPKVYGERSQVDIDVKIRKEVSADQMAELRGLMMQKAIPPPPDFEDAEEVDEHPGADFNTSDDEDDNALL